MNSHLGEDIQERKTRYSQEDDVKIMKSSSALVRKFNTAQEDCRTEIR